MTARRPPHAKSIVVSFELREDALEMRPDEALQIRRRTAAVRFSPTKNQATVHAWAKVVDNVAGVRNGFSTRQYFTLLPGTDRRRGNHVVVDRKDPALDFVFEPSR